MNNRDQRRYQRLTRVQTFGRERAADFAGSVRAAALFANVDRYIVELESARVQQTPQRLDKASLLKALRDDARNLGRIAKVVDQEIPGFSRQYRVPVNTSEELFLTFIDSLLARLEDAQDDDADTQAGKAALRARFLDYDTPPDFLQTLRQDREALRTANQHNRTETQDGVESTAHINSILNAAGNDIKALDAIVNNRYAREPDKLHVWRAASRIESAPRKAKTNGPASTPNGA